MAPKRQREDQLRQAAWRAQRAAAASPDPVVAEAAFRASQARDAHRVSQSSSRQRSQAAAAARPVANGAQLDALLDADVFTPEDLDLIFASQLKTSSLI